MKYEINPSLSINEALKKLKPGDVLYLKDGIYNEKVEVFVPNIEIIGESKDNTIIQNKDFFHKIMPDFNECNTFRTYTFYVNSDNVTIKDLTIKNLSIPSSKYGQAVALHVDGTYFLADNIKLESRQDTLFTGPLPKDLQKRHIGFLRECFRQDKKTKQKFINSDIIGDVDFIFGCATAIFYKCNIISMDRGQKKNEAGGYLCAPAHEKEDKLGYLFLKCNLVTNDDAKNVYFARPWRDYGFAAFIDCNTGNHINEKGFSNWPKTKRYETARFYEYNDNIDLSNRVNFAHILSKDEKEKLIKEYIDFDSFFKI